MSIDERKHAILDKINELKEEGVEFPGRMRDHVAEACKVSKSKIARLKVIREGLDAGGRTGVLRRDGCTMAGV